MGSQRPTPPLTRLVSEHYTGEPCVACGSSMMAKRFWLFGPRPGCIQPKCKNFGGDRDMHRMMEIRREAARMWLKEGGHMPYQNGGVIHEFMVQHPDTRIEYETRAAIALGWEPA